MKIRFGYELIYTCSQPVPMILMLHTHHSRSADLVHPDRMITEPEVPLDIYADAFGKSALRDDFQFEFVVGIEAARDAICADEAADQFADVAGG